MCNGVPIYEIILRYGPGAADRRKPVLYESANELKAGDSVQLDGRRWRLGDQMADAGEHPTFQAEPEEDAQT